MTDKLWNNLWLLLGFLIVTALVLFNLNNSFFWDTIQLGSEHANHYFSTNFSSLLLPNDIDSGHIPTFGFYLALLWKLFGRSLIVSHLAVLPFAIGIVWQLHRLTRRFISGTYSGIALLLILIDPTLLSQITMVSPDVALVFFFLMGINAVLDNNKIWIGLSVVLLFLTSMRGMMVSLCLLSLDLYCNVAFWDKFKAVFTSLLKRSVIYLPGLLLFITYNAYHYASKGWIGYHKNSPWADCFERVDFKGFVYNIGMFGWRLLDLGKAGIWLMFMILFVTYRRQILQSKHARLLLFFVVVLLVLLPANMLWAKNLLAHRYLLPIYIAFALSAAVILFSDYVSRKMKYTLGIIWFTVLVTGNYWVLLYPPKLSKGWEATLAHLPYYNLRKQALLYLDEKKIDYQDVGSFFPNTAMHDDIDLNQDRRIFATFDGNSPYVFYSNVYNIPDGDYDKLNEAYRIVQRFENQGIFVTIYKKK